MDFRKVHTYISKGINFSAKSPKVENVYSLSIESSLLLQTMSVSHTPYRPSHSLLN